MIRRRGVLTGALATAVLLVACGGGSHQDLEGPCYVVAEEPSLVVSAATSASGVAIPVLTLSDVRVDGEPIRGPLPSTASNVRVSGSTLECTIPCGFTETEGTVAFTAVAPGYAATPISATAAFSDRDGSCPLRLSKGSRVSVRLNPL